MFEILYHIFVCPLFCIAFHYIFHRKYDKKHIHIDYDEVARRVKGIIEQPVHYSNNEIDTPHFCSDKCGTKGSSK